MAEEKVLDYKENGTPNDTQRLLVMEVDSAGKPTSPQGYPVKTLHDYFKRNEEAILSSINASKGEVTTMKNEVTSMKDSVTGLKNDVTQLKSDVIASKTEAITAITNTKAQAITAVNEAKDGAIQDINEAGDNLNIGLVEDLNNTATELKNTLNSSLNGMQTEKAQMQELYQQMLAVAQKTNVSTIDIEGELFGISWSINHGQPLLNISEIEKGA